MPFPSKTDRAAILAAAMDVVKREGIEKLSIRSLAATLGLAPNALYRYFASLAVLEAAIAEESQILLLQAMRKAAAHRSPEDSIRAISRAYLRFAREQSRLFALTLRPSSPSTEGDPAHVQCWKFVLAQVTRVYGVARAPEAAVALWAFIHGMTVLHAAQVLGDPKPASSFEFGLRMWLQSAATPADNRM